MKSKYRLFFTNDEYNLQQRNRTYELKYMRPSKIEREANDTT
jgi:hypothetical protein